MKLNYRFDLKTAILIGLALFYLYIIIYNIFGSSMKFSEGVENMEDDEEKDEKENMEDEDRENMEDDEERENMEGGDEEKKEKKGKKKENMESRKVRMSDIPDVTSDDPITAAPVTDMPMPPTSA